MEAKTIKLYGAAAALIFLCIAHFAVAEDLSCFYCGMKKSTYGHSWMIIQYDDHSTSEFCSLHCACIDMLLHTEMTVLKVLVKDYKTQKFIEADGAAWVIGGSKPGVMTTRAKWAFETKTVAAAFIEKFGGRAADYETAVEAAMEDMYKDMMMIQEKRKEKRSKMMEDNN